MRGTTSANAGLRLSPELPSCGQDEHASTTPQSRTPSVKSCMTLLQFLLVATHGSHETDFQGALHDRRSQQNETAYELVYFDLGRKLDFFEVLLLLEHVRTVFFATVLVAPPANTWSKSPPQQISRHSHGPRSISRTEKLRS